MTKAVFDSDVLIDYLQGIPAARDEMERYDLPLYSVISFTELLAGARTDEERRAAEGLLASLRRVDLTESIARRAVDLRQSLRLKLPDAIVLATAEVEGCILVTRNTRDFPANDPRVRFPYTV
jgi:predicted nucleic acid-binding protein